MRVPDRLEPLLAHGVIEEVLRPLMSGKEAEVFLVLAEGEERVAKVYKNAQFRSFQHRAEYTEGRGVRSSREQRAMNKRSRHGRSKTEEAWRSAEVDAIQLLRGAGVRVPKPYAFTEGVLVMELIRGEDGEPAPRLVDTHFSPEEAVEVFHILLREVIKMLCAGIIHADLSDFNVLMSADGPVIIDLPQAIDPARNQGARKMLVRDVKNLTSFLGRSAPELLQTQYGPEMWDLYERSELYPDTELTGKYEGKAGKADVSSLLEDIMAVAEEARERREALGLPPPRRARRPVIFEDVPEPPKPAKPAKGRGPKPGGRGGRPGAPQGGPKQGGPRPGGPNSAGPDQPKPDQQAAPGDPPKKRRRRRRKRSGGEGEHAHPTQPPTQPPRPAQAAAKAPPGSDGAPKRRRRRRRGPRGGPGSGTGSSGGGGGGGST